MDFSKNISWFGLRGCLYCGSLLRYSDGLCNSCSENLWSWASPRGELFQQQVHKLEVLSLFQWVPGRQEVLSRLVHALKGKHGEELWTAYAEEFQRRRIPESLACPSRPFLVIPSPAKNGSSDHATLFANALAKGEKGLIYNCLLRENTADKQKKKSRSQRQRTTLGWRENFSNQDFAKMSVEKHIVFVDDVVTTGSTAVAAWRTLGKPRDFSVWALAQRGLSCGASKSLV
jgi:predicted amidophosphoribosyltransferase